MLSIGLSSFFLKSEISSSKFSTTEFLYVSISECFRLDVRTLLFSFCFRVPFWKFWFLLSMPNLSSKPLLLQAPSLSFLPKSFAYESFRRFLHSENTRSDAFVLIIRYCSFSLGCDNHHLGWICSYPLWNLPVSILSV